MTLLAEFFDGVVADVPEEEWRKMPTDFASQASSQSTAKRDDLALTDATHCCAEETQEFRLQNDRDWRAKLDHLKAMNSFRKARIEALEGALRGLLDALAMGPLEIAAKYGPDAHPDEPLLDAAHKAQAVLSA